MSSSLSRRQVLGLGLSSLSVSSLSGPASAAPAWPSRPVRIVVGFPGGSSPDLMARTVAEPLSHALGQPVIVENRVGAGGNIAAEAVAHANDMHTLGLMINGNMTIARLLNPKIHYDPLKDLRPVSLIATAPLILAAPAQQPGADTRAVLEAGRRAGEQWNYGSPGVGTVAHLGMELLKVRARLGAVHVPYPGNPQVITAMMGGQVQLALLPPGLALAQVKAGKLRALGVTSSTRSALAPEVPSLAEAGVTGFNLEIWNAIAAPASLPTPIVERLSGLISEIARSAEVRAKLFQMGWQVTGSTAEGLANRIQADTASMGAVIRQQRISAE